MKNIKFRHEIKHYINVLDYLVIRSRLRQFMRLDENADINGEYKIRSLYFDNYQDKALMEKINGVNPREKFRLRFYNYDHTFIRLEKKCKINRLATKESVGITKLECEALLSGDIDYLKNSNRYLFNELYFKMKSQLLRPKTIVEYIREAYIYPTGNVRITFDKSIRTGICSTCFFDVDLPIIEALHHQYIVLEVKYDEFLPELINDIIQTNERRAAAISKYEISRFYG